MKKSNDIKKLLDEISVIPGVTGSCIFDRHEGTLCKNADASMAALAHVGSYFHRILKLGKITGLQVTGTTYRFDSCTVVCTPLTTKALLLTVCNAKANCSLVATTAAMLASDIQRHLQENELIFLGEEESVQEVGKKTLGEEPTHTSGLQEYFLQIEEALAEAIGPVAGMILQDYIVKWQHDGPASLTRLSDLVVMLVEEIQGEDLIKAFLERTKRIV